MVSEANRTNGESGVWSTLKKVCAFIGRGCVEVPGTRYRHLVAGMVLRVSLWALFCLWALYVPLDLLRQAWEPTPERLIIVSMALACIGLTVLIDSGLYIRRRRAGGVVRADAEVTRDDAESDKFSREAYLKRLASRTNLNWTARGAISGVLYSVGFVGCGFLTALGFALWDGDPSLGAVWERWPETFLPSIILLNALVLLLFPRWGWLQAD